MKTVPKAAGRKKRWLLAFLLLLMVAVGFGFVFRTPILTGLARVWVVQEPVTTADAIVVLGGNAQGRAGAAAAMFHRGVAPKILVMNVALNENDKLGLCVGESALIQAVLVAAKVPTNAISLIGVAVSSTHEEALALRDWARAHHPRTVVVPTDLFHTRRVDWWFGKILHGSGVDVRVAAIEMPKYAGTNWWRQEEGLLAFQNEVLKAGYYLLKY